MTLSDYLLAEMDEIADLPTLDEWVARVRSRAPVQTGESSAAVIRRLREEL